MSENEEEERKLEREITMEERQEGEKKRGGTWRAFVFGIKVSVFVS